MSDASPESISNDAYPLNSHLRIGAISLEGFSQNYLGIFVGNS